MKSYIFHKPLVSSVIKIESELDTYESRRIKKHEVQRKEVSFELFKDKKLASVIEEKNKGEERVWDFSFNGNHKLASYTAPGSFALLEEKSGFSNVLQYYGEKLYIKENKDITVEQDSKVIAKSSLHKRFPLKKYELKIAEDIPTELKCIILLFFSLKYTR